MARSGLSSAIQRPLAPDVDVGGRAGSARKTRNSKNPNHASSWRITASGIEKDDLDVEEDEEHRRQVEADREALLRGGRPETPDSNGIVRARDAALGRVEKTKLAIIEVGIAAREARRSGTATSRRTPLLPLVVPRRGR
jgi:hypothetical protein